MTEKEARLILSGPLVFGDARQIEALRFLKALEDCPEAAQCSACEGEGTIEEECDECDGSGVIYKKCAKCDGTGAVLK